MPYDGSKVETSRTEPAMNTSELTKSFGADKITSAIARRLARDAAVALDWNRAAALYEYAADVYPTQIGQLAQKDIAALRQEAANCRKAA